MLVSVIIPVYNSEATIAESLESVIKSVSKVTEDYEIIAINDGSKDNSLSILLEVSNEYKNLIVIDQKNMGAAHARNVGLELAKGDIIGFNDSDDVWLPDSFSSRMLVFDQFSDVSCVAANHDVDKQNVRFLKKVYKNIYAISLKAELFKCYFSPPTVLLKRRVIDSGLRFNSLMSHAEEGYFFNHVVSKNSCVLLNKMASKSILGKKRFGESGLSGDLSKMERGELYHLYNAYREIHGSLFLFFLTVIFSLLKYARRVLLVKSRRFF